MRKADRIMYSVLSVGGLYIMIEGLKIGYIKKGMMGPGFFPLLIGLLLILLSLGSLIKDFITNKNQDNKENKIFASKEEIVLLIKVLGSATIAIIITKITGLLISIGLMSGYLGWVYGEKKWRNIVLLVVLVPSFLYLLFDFAFGVPIPTGILRF